jgi:hypothetical protein
VRLLRAAATRRGRRFRPSDLPRLLLRCALLAAVALALAAPRWRARPDRAPTAPWALADPRLLQPQGAAQAPRLALRLAHLRRQGAVVRALAPGLPPEVAAEGPAGPPPDLWSLLREADARAPAGAPFHLLVFDRAASLGGRRPALGRPVEVVAVPEPGENRWIESARRRSDGSLWLVVGQSAAGGTTFERLSLAAGASAAAAGVAVERAGQEWRARLVAGGEDAADDELRLAPAEDATIVLRSSPGRAREAAFLRAGLEAAAHACGLEVAIAGAGPEPAAGPAGIQFLLDVEPSTQDAEWLRSGGWRVVEAPAAPRECETRADLALGPRGVPVHLRRCAAGEEGVAARVPLAVDGRGAPLLTARRVGRGLELELHVGLSPSDSDLVLHGAFPAALAALLEARWPASTAARAASDRRSAGAALIEPERAAIPSATTQKVPASPRPESLAWLAVAGLFAAERLAGWRQRRGAA